MYALQCDGLLSTGRSQYGATPITGVSFRLKTESILPIQKVQSLSKFIVDIGGQT